MKKHYALGVVGVILLALAGLGTRALHGAAEDPAANLEVTDNPGIVLDRNVHAADLTVYGVKLGDSIDNIPAKASTVKRLSTQNSAVTYCVGPNVAYVGFEGKVVEIVVGGDFATRMPPYDATRLQVNLGKADQVDAQDTTDHPTHYSYFTRQLRFTLNEPDEYVRSHIAAVTIYAP